MSEIGGLVPAATRGLHFLVINGGGTFFAIIILLSCQLFSDGLSTCCSSSSKLISEIKIKK